MPTLRRFIWLFVALVALLLMGTPTHAQSKTLIWERFDVDIEVLPSGDFIVTETNVVWFQNDTFSYGYRDIPTNRLESIEDVAVTVDGKPLDESAVDTEFKDNTFHIEYHFDEPLIGKHTIVLRYRVIGGLRYYEEGDQLWWKAVYSDRSAPMLESRITVRLPAGATPGPIASYGHPATYTVEGNTVRFEASNIPGGQEVEVRVQFPHGIVAGEAAAWQRNEDRWRTRASIINVGSIVLALLILAGGTVLPIVWWYTKGRDPEVGEFAEYITEPPDDLPPGIVGTLLDEKADIKDVIATIFDLARRGIISIEENQTSHLGGLLTSTDVTFHLVDESKPMYPFEQQLVRRLFKDQTSVQLSSLRNRFYKELPQIYKAFYEEVVNLGFFPQTPEKTRIKAFWVIMLIMLAMCGISSAILVAAGDRSPQLPTLFCIPMALFPTAFVSLFILPHLVRKTTKGAETAARWRAFQRYLQNIEQYGDTFQLADKWETFLPYAIAFGIDRRFLKQISTIEAPPPRWWARRRRHRDRLDTEGDFWSTRSSRSGSSGSFSMQQASDSMGSGLQSLSRSITSMIQGFDDTR
ncbi:hypothetical protein ARMA_2846 [Ardenticatena maritima]|uniref:DUF2207 domain-containing protein n=1 Tax=Ardenticatena maritima TaxID=872965 RepID=A0A0M8K998_9CHLR|nr:DUF2207 domain-containing protein [Ardenticatena maritima]GAP64423.1 hypothetical protein ARMA_2846 [Ardenticatena maritima]